MELDMNENMLFFKNKDTNEVSIFDLEKNQEPMFLLLIQQKMIPVTH